MINKMIGRRLRALRMAQNINQVALAKRVGVTQPYIVALEKGRENPTLAILVRLSKALNVHLTDIFKLGDASMGELTEEEKKWNDEVKSKAAQIDQVAKWADELVGWGQRNKDWHTERAGMRIVGALKQAIAETYDLQYFRDEKERESWRGMHPQ